MQAQKTGYRQEIVNEISENIKNAKSFYVTSFGSLSVTKLEGLRKGLRKNASSHFVVKNTLGKIALKQCGYEQIANNIKGACAISFSSNETTGCLKNIVDFKKENEGFSIVGGVYSGQVFDEVSLVSLAKLPSREEIISQLLSSMLAPLSNFVGVSKEVIAGFVRVVDGYSKTKQKGA